MAFDRSNLHCFTVHPALVRSLFAPSSTAACNKNLTQDVRFESPLATVHGLDAVKGVLELWATLGSEVTIRSTDYNDE